MMAAYSNYFAENVLEKKTTRKRHDIVDPCSQPMSNTTNVNVVYNERYFAAKGESFKESK